MLFTCPKCQTQYDFDETQIPPEGVTVQCTNCPQIFEVRKPIPVIAPVAPRMAPPAPVPVMPPQEEWEIKQSNGASFKFKELATLQKWIIERKVSRNDHIRKGQGNWKRLGEIPELTSFFKVVEQQHQAPAAPSYPQPTASGFQSNNEMPVPSAYYPNNQGWPSGTPAPTPMAPSYTPTNSDYAIMQNHKKHYFLRSFGVIVVALGLGAGAFYYVAPESFDHSIAQPIEALLGLNKTSPEALAAFNQAQEKVNQWDTSSLEEASNLLFRATTLQKEYVAAIALMAQVKLMQADLKNEQLYWLEKNGLYPEQQTKLRLSANHLSEEAFNQAKKALELSPNNRVALRVMIDYYRHKKALTQAEPIIRQALNFPNEYLDITLGMAYIEDKETAEKGLELLKKGLEALPSYNHGRYFLAKYYYEQNKYNEAKSSLAPLFNTAPKHDVALTLKGELEKPVATAAPAVNKSNTKQAAAAPAAPTTAQLLQRAKLLRGNDRTKEALAIYEKLVDEDSSNIQAHLGMGWCYIDLGYNTPAITSFKQVLSININNAEAYYGLAEAYKAQKNKAEALKNYKLFIQLAPNHPEVGIAKQMIENLQ